jgi:hypothetical protein
MLRLARHVVGVVAFTLSLSFTNSVWAISANPLQSAYWRFEEGAEFGRVTPRNSDVIVDSINNNKMRAYMDANVDASPTYTSNVPPKPLKSGLPNTLALDFIPNQDIYAQGQQIGAGGIKRGTGFTVEAAFYAANPNRYGGIIAKEGVPTGTGLPTFAVKTTGPGDAAPAHLRLQEYDGAKNLVSVDSLAAINPSQWYYMAAVNDGSQLSLWLDSGSGYQLQGTTAVNGALYQGPPILGDLDGDTAVTAADYVWWRKNDSANTASYAQFRADYAKRVNWDNNWTIGRAQFNNGPADWFDGTIDEVRLTNSALAPADFLFAPSAAGSGVAGGSVPEPASVALVALVLCGAAAAPRSWRRRR